MSNINKCDPEEFEKIFDLLNKIPKENNATSKPLEKELDLYYYYESNGKRTNEFNKVNDIEGC